MTIACRGKASQIPYSIDTYCDYFVYSSRPTSTRYAFLSQYHNRAVLDTTASLYTVFCFMCVLLCRASLLLLTYKS